MCFHKFFLHDFLYRKVFFSILHGFLKLWNTSSILLCVLCLFILGFILHGFLWNVSTVYKNSWVYLPFPSWLPRHWLCCQHSCRRHKCSSLTNNCYEAANILKFCTAFHFVLNFTLIVDRKEKKMQINYNTNWLCRNFCCSIHLYFSVVF